MRRWLALAMLLSACDCSGPATSRSSGALIAPPVAGDLDPSEGVVRVSLRAAPIDAHPFRYAYNESNPGPTIRAKRGEEVIVEFTNALPSATSIHWHGLKVPWAMDGASWMQDPVAPGASFTYRFRVEQTGTFWYHPHFDTDDQVDGGLYGLLVVGDPADPPVDEEWLLVFDTEGEAHVHGSAAGHARREEHWLVNGVHQPRIEAAGGRRVRARLLNASNASYLALRWPGLRQIAADQGLLAELREPSRLVLAPGDRAEVEILLGDTDLSISTDPYTLNGGDALGEPMELLRVMISAPAAAPAGANWPFVPGGPSADPGYADVVYAFAGSDRLETGFINGERFPNITVEEVGLGSRVAIEVRNLSPSEHPFHLHGVVFEVVSINGAAPPFRMIEDTFNLGIRDRIRVLIEADNPGEWMAHCHILPHAEHGMMTVLRIR